MAVVRIISTQKIEVMRELAFNDKTPDLANVGTVISGNALMRVNTLKPVSYKFEVGSNEVPDPHTFKDPVTRQMVTESILDWKGVRYLIRQGVFEAFTDDGIMTVEKLEAKDAKKAKKAKSNKKEDVEPKKEEPKKSTTGKKSLTEVAKETK